jgi:hypothetical protein
VTHPEERFWQALRNWSGHRFLYASESPLWTFGQGTGLVDTFNFEHGTKLEPMQLADKKRNEANEHEDARFFSELGAEYSDAKEI